MIDRMRRDKIADLMHEYLIGLKTNFEFERERMDLDRPTFAPPLPGDDLVISPMMERSFWYGFHHGDLDEYRLDGKYKLRPEQREQILRWILFLRSDLEYQWPSFQFEKPIWQALAYPFLCITTFGYWGRLKRRRFKAAFEEFKSCGEYDVWPFLRRADFETTRQATCPFSRMSANGSVTV